MRFDAAQQGLLQSNFAWDNVFHTVVWISFVRDTAYQPLAISVVDMREAQTGMRAFADR